MSLTDAQLGAQLASLVADFRDNQTATAKADLISAVSDLFAQAGLVLPTVLAQHLQDHVNITEQWIVQFRAWAVGAADGGPAGDGLFPLIDRNGAIAYLPSPEKIRSELFGLTPRGSVAHPEDLDALTGLEVGDVYTDQETGHAWTWTLDQEWMDLGQFRGPTVFDVWVKLPENAGKTPADYFRWLADAQKGEVQPLLDAAIAASQDAALSASEAAQTLVATVAAKDAAEAAQTVSEAVRDQVALDAAAVASDLAESKLNRDAIAIDRTAVEAAALVAAGEADAATAAAATATTKAQAAQDSATAADLKAQDADAARILADQIKVDTAAIHDATDLIRDDASDKAAQAALAAQAAAGSAQSSEESAIGSNAARQGSEAAQARSEAAQAAAELARDEAQAIAGGNFQPSDPTLTAVANQTWTSGKIIFAMTAQDEFTPLSVGASTDSDILSRIAADSRYRLNTVAVTIGEVTDLQDALDAKATPADIQAAIDALVAGAPGALDTLYEIAEKFAADDDAMAALLVTVGEKAGQAAVDALTTRIAALEAAKPVLTVNGITPDVAGNIIVQTGDQAPSLTTLERTNGVLTTVTETVDGDPRVTTLTRSGGVLTQTATTYRGKTLTSVFTRTNGRVTAITPTEA